MDETRLERITQHVVALNRFALARLRQASNEDPIAASERYRTTLIFVQRIGRFPHTALHRLGDIALPVIRSDHDSLLKIAFDAEQAIDLPPGLRPPFEGGNDPDLALAYLTTLREDTWRDERVAAVRWCLPLPVIHALAEAPIPALHFIAKTMTMRFIEPPAFPTLLELMEASPMSDPEMVTALAVLNGLADSKSVAVT